MGRVLAIGDIHGCLKSFELLLAIVQPSHQDTLITLGDYVDRGPRSCQVIERLIALRQQTQLIPLRGNHEAMMIEARSGMTSARRWMLSGGSETLDSYESVIGRVAQLEDIPQTHWSFICRQLKPYWETDEFIFVHGAVASSQPLSKQSDTIFLWQGYSSMKQRHCSGKTIICGHELQNSGLPVANEHAICIDTGAWDNGWLTCLDPINRYCWQANERGHTRQFDLDSV